MKSNIKNKFLKAIATSLLLTASIVPTVAQAEAFIGEVRIFSGNFAPRGWAFCEGQILPIAENTALYSIIGTTYGGNGRTTMGLPDLRGRSVVGTGRGPGLNEIRQGSKMGAQSIRLTQQQLPSVSSVETSVVTQITTDDVAARLGTANSKVEFKAIKSVTNGIVSSSISGAGAPVTTQSPILALRYIICMDQCIYPSRD